MIYGLSNGHWDLALKIKLAFKRSPHSEAPVGGVRGVMDNYDFLKWEVRVLFSTTGISIFNAYI